MQTYLKTTLLAIFSWLSLSTQAQLIENFNSRPGITVAEVPAYLSESCWQFVDFDTDPNNWDPAIEGDGAIISVPNSNNNIDKSIYTPLVDIAGDTRVRFSYIFSNTNAKGNYRNLRIFLTDRYNNIAKRLDSMDLSGKNDAVIFSYDSTFRSVASGEFKVLFNYKQTGVATRIAIDNMILSAPIVNPQSCTPGVITPVSLVDLGGSYKGDGNVRISWTTTFESNSDRFEVERSLDGKIWDRTGTIAAQGYSTIRHQYEFNDQVGKNTANRKDIFYRLRQVDKNGKFALSRILIVRVYNTQSVSTISVTPNPAKRDISVQFQLNQSSMTVIRVRDMQGRELQKKVAKYDAGDHNVLMEGSSPLRPGIYVLEVVVNGKERMIVQLIKE